MRGADFDAHDALVTIGIGFTAFSVSIIEKGANNHDEDDKHAHQSGATHHFQLIFCLCESMLH